MPFLTVGQVSRQVGVAPWVLSNLFYRGRLDDALCPVVMGRRQIPPDYVPEIRKAIRRSGYELSVENRAAE